MRGWLRGGQMTTTDKEAKSLLGGFEALFGSPPLIDQLPLINKVLLTLFEADILEEEFLLDWGAHVSSKVRLFFPSFRLPFDE
jgi:translation initiation factor 5